MIAIELLVWVALGMGMAVGAIALSGPPSLRWRPTLVWGAIGGATGGFLGRLLSAPTLDVPYVRLLSLLSAAAGAGVVLLAEWNIRTTPRAPVS